MDKLNELLRDVVLDLYGLDIEPELTVPEPQFGDLSTNVAMRLSKQLGKNPRDIAEQIKLQLKQADSVKSVTVAGPGFINLFLTDSTLLESWVLEAPQTYKGKTVVAEYSDPNPFKVLHAGHLYTSVVGDSIANIIESAGAKVYRVNFGGDVGLHVGKTMWGIIKKLDGENPENLARIEEKNRADWLAKCYVEGTAAYDEDNGAKQKIIEYNKQVYSLHTSNDHTSTFAQIYWACRQWSYDYFDEFYELIGSHFDKYYPESQTSERGIKEVKKHIGTIFEQSDGAVIFRGEPFGLHTRVFINQEGLPTYETKDVGLIYCKYDDYKFDKSIVITANEQAEYMKVVLKAIEQFDAPIAQATTHITHGIVKLAGGVKMSSRKGNFLRAIDILNTAKEANKKANNQQEDYISLGAVKYSFLKQRIGGDIVYNPEESISLNGNSGPYLQYAHARARSILSKSTIPNATSFTDLTEHERLLARALTHYQLALTKSINDLMPHHICTYLYELAQVFNRFYENSKVVGDEREAVRRLLVERYADTLKSGLSILGIEAPNKM